MSKEEKRDFAATQAEERASDGSGQNEIESEFVAAVKRGIASAERGDFVEHEEVLARIERLLQF